MTLAPFRNEAFFDFAQPDVRAARDAALAKAKSELGREYPILIGGERITTTEKLISVNPSRPSEVIGIHQKATAEMAKRAVESAHAFFPEWSRTPVKRRVELALKVSDLIRQRRMELDAWLVLEAGKTWPETEPDSCEAIDFIEYYARQMLKLENPEPLVQMPGEKGRLAYMPLGVGVIVPPWNFPLAILTGMAMAALIGGNPIVLKPSSETPTIAAKFCELMLEAGVPPQAFAFLPGSGAVIGDLLVEHPLTRFVAFTGSKDVGLRINELAAKPRPGQKWIKRVVAEMGGKDAIVVDSEADVDAAVEGVVAAAFGYQGQKCSACSRAIVDAKVYDEFLEKLVARAKTLTVGAADEPGLNLGPVISASAQKSILGYIEVGRGEGRVVLGGGKAPGEGYYIEPTIIADVDAKARIFQEEIFGPVLAVAKARDFDHALEMANDSEYGLTGALYSRNRAKLDRAAEEFFVGNLYFNRKCTGAMVGANPFGGFNMSGTDSKAGGPDYMLQFLQAKSIAEKVS